MYSSSPSITATGSSSRIAAARSPFASAGVAGVTSFHPGSVHVVGFARLGVLGRELQRRPRGAAEDDGHRKPCPLVMYSILAALLMTWSRARNEKLKVMNSQIGRSPVIAAPTQSPVKPSSLIGESTTRRSPYRSSIPRETL